MSSLRLSEYEKRMRLFGGRYRRSESSEEETRHVARQVQKAPPDDHHVSQRNNHESSSSPTSAMECEEFRDDAIKEPRGVVIETTASMEEHVVVDDDNVREVESSLPDETTVASPQTNSAIDEATLESVQETALTEPPIEPPTNANHPTEPPTDKPSTRRSTDSAPNEPTTESPTLIDEPPTQTTETLLASTTQPPVTLETMKQTTDVDAATATTTGDETDSLSPPPLCSPFTRRQVEEKCHTARKLLRQALLRETLWEDRPQLARAAFEQALAARCLWEGVDDVDESWQQACQHGIAAVCALAWNPHQSGHAKQIKTCMQFLLPFSSERSKNPQATPTTATLVTSTYERNHLNDDDDDDDDDDEDDTTQLVPDQNKMTSQDVLSGGEETLNTPNDEDDDDKSKANHDGEMNAPEAPKAALGNQRRVLSGWRTNGGLSKITETAPKRNWFRRRNKKQVSIAMLASTPSQDVPSFPPLERESKKECTITVKIDDGSVMDANDSTLDESLDRQVTNSGNLYAKTNQELQKALWMDKTEELTSYDGVQMFGPRFKPPKEEQDDELIFFLDCVGLGSFLEPDNEPELADRFDDNDDDEDNIVLPEPGLDQRSLKMDPSFINVAPGPAALLTARSWDKLLEANAAESTDRPVPRTSKVRSNIPRCFESDLGIDDDCDCEEIVHGGETEQSLDDQSLLRETDFCCKNVNNSAGDTFEEESDDAFNDMESGLETIDEEHSSFEEKSCESEERASVLVENCENSEMDEIPKESVVSQSIQGNHQLVEV